MKSTTSTRTRPPRVAPIRNRTTPPASAGGFSPLLTLIFRRSTPESVSKGPVDALRFDGELLEDGAGRLLARHVKHAWKVDGQEYLRLDCEDPVRVHFEGPGGRSPDYGPFTHFSSADGIAYANREVFAHYDEQAARWFSRVERTYWPTMVLEPFS